MEPTRVWCRVTVLGQNGVPAGTVVMQGRGGPDMGTVDVLAQLALAAKRAGGRLVLRDVEPGLEDLLRLTGIPIEADGR